MPRRGAKLRTTPRYVFIVALKQLIVTQPSSLNYILISFYSYASEWQDDQKSPKDYSPQRLPNRTHFSAQAVALQVSSPPSTIRRQILSEMVCGVVEYPNMRSTWKKSGFSYTRTVFHSCSTSGWSFGITRAHPDLHILCLPHPSRCIPLPKIFAHSYQEY